MVNYSSRESHTPAVVFFVSPQINAGIFHWGDQAFFWSRWWNGDRGLNAPSGVWSGLPMPDAGGEAIVGRGNCWQLCRSSDGRSAEWRIAQLNE